MGSAVTADFPRSSRECGFARGADDLFAPHGVSSPISARRVSADSAPPRLPQPAWEGNGYRHQGAHATSRTSLGARRGAADFRTETRTMYAPRANAVELAHGAGHIGRSGGGRAGPERALHRHSHTAHRSRRLLRRRVAPRADRGSTCDEGLAGPVVTRS